MRKILFSVLALISGGLIFKPFAIDSNAELVLEKSSNDSIYSGHHSHCSHSSHASHFSSMNGEKRNEIHITNNVFIKDVFIPSNYADVNLKNCILKAFISDVTFVDSLQSKFSGEALVIVIKDDYGNYSRSPRIKATTHIIPLNSSVPSFFTSNGHIGFSNNAEMSGTLSNELKKQFEGDWILRNKEDWMYKLDSHFYENILQKIY